MVFSTPKGDISSDLHDFILLVDGQGAREADWLMKCCTCLAMNDVKSRVDLIGLSFDDLTFEIEQEDDTVILSGGQRSWVRRCIEKANKEFVGRVAERGDDEPAQGEASAIKALVDTIKNEEVCFCFFVLAN